MKNSLVRSWMTSPVRTVTPKTYIVDARRIMNAERIRALPVVQDEKVVGIITWRGLLRADLPVLDEEVCCEEVSLKEKRVEDIMTVKPIGVLPNTLMPKAARIMMENKITVLPVFDSQGGCQGILTSSDIFRFILDELPDLKHALYVSDYMVHELTTVNPDTSLLEAQRQMAIKRIRALPVLEEENLVGLVTRTDLMRAIPSRFTSPGHQEQSLAILLQPVEKIMVRDLITVTPDEPLQEAARLMLENKIHCLPVVGDRGELIGILTESDLFKMVTQKFF